MIKWVFIGFIVEAVLAALISFVLNQNGGDDVVAIDILEKDLILITLSRLFFNLPATIGIWSLIQDRLKNVKLALLLAHSMGFILYALGLAVVTGNSVFEFSNFLHPTYGIMSRMLGLSLITPLTMGVLAKNR